MRLEDGSLMPFGKHKGEMMVNVPASYLLYLYNEGLDDGNVKDYIEENMDHLESEVEEE